MKTRRLGKTGLKVSEIGFGGEWLERHSVEESVEVIRYAHAKGINILDCWMADPKSRDIIGKGIGLPNQIIDLDSPRIDDVTATVIKGISNRKSIKQHLESYKSIVAKSRETLLSII